VESVCDTNPALADDLRDWVRDLDLTAQNDGQKPQKTWTTIRRDGDTVVLEVAGVVLHLSLGEASTLGQELMKAVYGKGEIQFVRWE
jgi:hypothetical protein